MVLDGARRAGLAVVNAIERLLRRVSADANGCWLWQGALFKNGYGKIGVNGSVMYAHRVAYAHLVAPIPTGLCVLHTCDVRNCCNPEHLWIGTLGDNNRDAIRKGRNRPNPPRGERHPRAVLNEAKVREIRARYEKGESQLALAAAFKVRAGTIWFVITRKKWKHVQ